MQFIVLCKHIVTAINNAHNAVYNTAYINILKVAKSIGRFVRIHGYVDGHCDVLNGKRPVANCYNPHWSGPTMHLS